VNMPSRPNPVVHQLDDADAPGGTDLEVQLLTEADTAPPRLPDHSHPRGLLGEVDGMRFPSAFRVTPPPPRDHPAEVYRREPTYEPTETLEIAHSPSTPHQDVGEGTHVQPDDLPGAPDQHSQLGYALLNFPAQLNATSPVLVLPMELAPTNGGIRRAITILNNGPGAALLAGSLEGCTAAFGFPLAVNAVLVLSEGVSGQLYAIGSAGATELRVLVEQGPQARRQAGVEQELAELCRLLRQLVTNPLHLPGVS
jgi:hypothetical protein